MKKIIKSAAIILAVAAVVVGVTMSFFSDEETSEGNLFTAGALDLKIDNECHYNGMVCTDEGWMDDPNDDNGPVETQWAQLGEPCSCTWNFEEWEDGNAILKFEDLKPGDWGENTVSFHLENPAWACLLVDTVIDDDNSCTEPEALAEGDECLDQDGELDENMEYAIWWDLDCDNVYDPDDEEVMVDAGDLGDVDGGLVVPIADTTAQSLVNGPVAAGTECVGIGWRIPSEAGNEMQTDSLGARLMFYVEQARHNDGFICGEQPMVEMRTLSLENKDENWDIISDDSTKGDIDYSHNDDSFHGTVTGQGLEINSKYQITLNGPGTCTTTDDNLATFGANLFQSGYWNDWAPSLASTCTGSPGEGIYNMNLISDWYTFETDGTGTFTYPFDLALPAGDYVGVKVLVKKVLDPFVSPWVDTSVEHTTNLFETAPISFTVVD